ncbi:MAG: lamin tail domain-containing protein [Candidatus Krumholzibacteriota bacterium]
MGFFHGSPETSPGAYTFRKGLPRAVFALWAALAPGASWGALVINELLPDPAGSDGGREFVELLNTGPDAVSLNGVLLQFGNGADGPFWLTRWTGEEGSWLESSARFLIVDRNWLGEPPGQAQVNLGLQNGPDALRLVREELVLDLVGYGPLTDQDMMEGEPAATATGRSLSRRPDGRDTGNNRLDFVLADPTPGRTNFHPYSLAVTGWELDPPSTDRVGQQVRFNLQVRNNGTEIFPVGTILLRVAGRDNISHLDRLPPDQERMISWNFRSELRGLIPLEILVPLPTGPDSLGFIPASLQVGPGDLIINEALAAPRHGQGEWVELAAAGNRSVDLAGHSLRDEEGSWRPLPDLSLDPGELVVLAQDSVALADWHLDNAAAGGTSGCGHDPAIARQRILTGWPSLNNTPPETRTFADRLYLAGPTGDVIDHVTFGSTGTLVGGDSDPGVSLERMAPVPRNPGASNWAPCTAQAGSTPGCPNSVASFGETSLGFSIKPRILDSEGGITAVHFLFTLAPGQTGWELRVFDLWGGLVRDLGGENLGPGPRDLLWDGRDDQGQPVGPGAYVVLLESLDHSHHRLAREKALMVVR